LATWGLHAAHLPQDSQVDNMGLECGPHALRSSSASLFSCKSKNIAALTFNSNSDSRGRRHLCGVSNSWRSRMDVAPLQTAQVDFLISEHLSGMHWHSSHSYQGNSKQHQVKQKDSNQHHAPNPLALPIFIVEYVGRTPVLLMNW